jgi:DNA-binding IclR family transcriptional regulator
MADLEGLVSTNESRPQLVSEGGPGVVHLDTSAGVRGVKSAARAVDLLELLASRQNRPARLREISDALEAPRSSVYALLRTLVERGWVRTDDEGVLYSIGIRALLAGTTYLDTDPYLRIVQPLITDLSSRLDETIHYGRLDRTDIVYLATCESSSYLRSFSRVGRRLPAFSTSMGKSLLAERLDEGLTDHLPTELRPLTAHTITDVDLLRKDLEQTRERGYAIDDEENFTGVVCFGFALRFRQPSTDAMSCSIPLERLNDERRALVVDEMQRTRQIIERMAPMHQSLFDGPG